MTAEIPETPIDELNRLTSDLVRLTSTDLSVTGDLTAPEFKQVLAAKRAELFAKQQEMELAAENARKQMEAAQQAARAAMLPLKKELARMAEGIWTVGLYLGAGEDLVPLRGGTPAPVGTPITVRQQVLAMDEECIIAAEDGGIDVRSIEDFDNWITSDPAHLQQVFPEPKGVVAILPSRQQRDYGDPWMNTSMKEANSATWFLIRNGERLYRLLANDFNVGARLIPRSDEFTSYFVKDNWGHPIVPGTPQWAEAEERAGAKQRHYMRVALVLQGLLERTDVFSPVPEGMSFLTLESYEQGQIISLSDDEKVLMSSRQPFKEWQKERMSKLRPGMRIVGAFNGQDFRYVGEREERYRHSRLSPETAEYPPTNTVLYVEQNARKEMVARYERNGESVWDPNEYNFRAPKNRASVRVLPSDTFIIPIDLVTIKEMEDYIGARSERSSYLSLVPLLKSAIAAKTAEHEEEAPFRKLIVDTLTVHHGADLESAQQSAEELVDWWKFANKHHRPLVSDDGEFVAKAMRMISKEYKDRQKLATNADDDAELVQAIRALEPKSMAVLRKRSGDVIVLVPYESAYDFTAPKVYFKQMKYSKGELTLLKEWSTIAPHQIAKMQTVWSNEMWTGWNTARSAMVTDLTDPEVDAIVSGIADKDEVLVARFEDDYNYGRRTKGFTVYLYRGETTDRDDGLKIVKRRITVFRTNGAVSTDTKGTHGTDWTDPDRAPWTEKGVVFRNDALIAKALADLAPIAAEYTRKSTISRRIGNLSYAAEQAWNTRAAEDSKASFAAEYGSADLWDKWVRSHPLPKCPVGRGVLNAAAQRFVEDCPVAVGGEMEFSKYLDEDNAKMLGPVTVKDWK